MRFQVPMKFRLLQLGFLALLYAWIAGSETASASSLCEGCYEWLDSQGCTGAYSCGIGHCECS